MSRLQKILDQNNASQHRANAAQSEVKDALEAEFAHRASLREPHVYFRVQVKAPTRGGFDLHVRIPSAATGITAHREALGITADLSEVKSGSFRTIGIEFEGRARQGAMATHSFHADTLEDLIGAVNQVLMAPIEKIDAAQFVPAAIQR